MRLKRKATAVILCLMLIGSLTACSSNSTGGAKSGESTVSSQQSASSPAFEMYKKINLGMTRDQVDAALGVAPTAPTGSGAVKGAFNYMNKDGENGVYVLFNDQNILYSKTVIYGSPKVLAPMTRKTVGQEQEKSIKKGMTDSEVSKILGGEGVECSATALPNNINNVGVIKRWGNKDGSLVQVVFNSEGKVGNSIFFAAQDY